MPTYTRPVVAQLLASGLGTALGYTVTSAAGTTLIARTTSGITEASGSGIYSANIANWDTAWSGRIAWDAGAGTLAVEAFVGEGVIGDVLAEELAGTALDEAGVSALLASGVTTLAAGSIATATFASGATIPRVTLADTATAITTKTGFALSATGLDAIAVTDPGGVAGHTTLPKMLVALWRRKFKKVRKIASSSTAGSIVAYADNGSTANTTQAYTVDTDGNQTQEAAS